MFYSTGPWSPSVVYLFYVCDEQTFYRCQWWNHRYLRKEDCLRHIGLQKIQLNKKGRSRRHKTSLAGQQRMLLWPIGVPDLTANIFAAPTGITNIHNKAGSMHRSQFIHGTLTEGEGSAQLTPLH